MKRSFGEDTVRKGWYLAKVVGSQLCGSEAAEEALAKMDAMIHAVRTENDVDSAVEFVFTRRTDVSIFQSYIGLIHTTVCTMVCTMGF